MKKFYLYIGLSFIFTLGLLFFFAGMTNKPLQEGSLILYYSQQCSACHSFLPVWNEVVPKLPKGVDVIAIECKDDNHDQWEGIYMVPTVHFYDKNKQKFEFKGPNTKIGLENFIQKLN